MTLNQRIAKLRRLFQSSNVILRYKGRKISNVDGDRGIYVYELCGDGGISDFVPFESSESRVIPEVDWTQIKVYTPMKNPFLT